MTWKIRGEGAASMLQAGCAPLALGDAQLCAQLPTIDQNWALLACRCLLVGVLAPVLEYEQRDEATERAEQGAIRDSR